MLGGIWICGWFPMTFWRRRIDTECLDVAAVRSSTAGIELSGTGLGGGTVGVLGEGLPMMTGRLLESIVGNLFTAMFWS